MSDLVVDALWEARFSLAQIRRLAARGWVPHETCLVEITRGLDTVVAERDAVRARLAAVVEVIEQAASEWDTLDGSDPAISRGMRMAADRVAAVPVPVPPRDESLYEPES
jgi:hypothetical protein